MKNAIKLVAMLAAMFLSATVWGEIRGSAHDFSTKSWAGGQICAVCHVPHNSTQAVVPLWNHESTKATFTLYSSPTFTATISQPSASSKACLSCHDGTVALDSFGGKLGTTYLTGPTLLGTDLSNDHPVSFLYDSALATSNGRLYDPATATSGIRTTIRADLLFNDRMECASCHDPHNNANQPGLLVKSNAGSALCLTCHKK